MKIIMVMVATLNGKITKGDDTHVHEWTSKEDQNYFSSLLKENNLLVMGSKTYESARKNMKLGSRQLRVVLTRSPERYRANAVPGKIEFSNESPQQLVKRLENKGFKQMLLLGGGTINTLFLKENLVDELYLTLEPKIFGKGKTFVKDESLETVMRLMSIKKLNRSGTLLLKYKILN